MKRAFTCVLCAVLSMVAFLSCSDDDNDTAMPSILAEFVEANTAADGTIRTITTDNGTIYTLNNKIKTDVADTTFRCVCNFTPTDGAHKATVYNIKHIYSFPPIPAQQFESHDYDPVHVQSVWKGGKYINIILGVMTSGNGIHACAFSEDSVTLTAEGTKTVHVSLLHKRPDNDIEAYTQKVYLSMPVSHYADSCQTIALSIPTYDGTKTYTF